MGMCGDSGGGDGGAEEMRRQEKERQDRIREGTNAINQIFGGKVTRQEPVEPPKPAAPARPASNGATWSIAGGRPVRAAGNAQNHTGGGVMEPARDPQQPGNASGYTGAAIRNLFGQTSGPIMRDVYEEVPGQFTDDFFNNLEKSYLDYYMPQFERQALDADRAVRIKLGRTGNLGSTAGARELARLAEDKESNRRRIIDESIKYGSGQRKALEDTRGNLIGQLEAGAGIENVAGQAAAQARAMTAPPAFSPLGDLFKNYTAAVANASLASGDPRFPGAEDQRRALLFNIPAAGGKNSSAGIVT